MVKAWADQGVLERMVSAVEAVRDRVRRVAAALETAGVPYAVVGGNAVAAWVSTVKRAAARSTQDVDLLLRRDNLTDAIRAVEAAGFIHHQLLGIDVFLDGPDADPSESVHVLFAGERVKPSYPLPSPDVTEAGTMEGVQIVKLEPLVRMKLMSFRRKDQVHLGDMIALGMVDATWLSRFPPELAARLQYLIDTPDD